MTPKVQFIKGKKGKCDFDIFKNTAKRMKSHILGEHICTLYS